MTNNACRRISALLFLVVGIAIAAGAGAAHAAPAHKDWKELERRSGGRLGVALVDARGRVLLGYRLKERFALCSTFKLPLAAAIIARSERHKDGKALTLETPLRFTRADLPPYAPELERRAAEGISEISAGDAARASVILSDNGTANLLLRLLGGPQSLTRIWRGWGDPATRLDRYEPDLNENRLGDVRDTTTPQAIAVLTSRLSYGSILKPEGRMLLHGWMAETRTGLKRIRAGVPTGWQVGDKTGTCRTAYNDVATLKAPSGRSYVLSVYLDRPTLEAQANEAIIADAAQIALAHMQGR